MMRQNPKFSAVDKYSLVLAALALVLAIKDAINAIPAALLPQYLLFIICCILLILVWLVLKLNEFNEE